jgi:hypothetical protein
MAEPLRLQPQCSQQAQVSEGFFGAQTVLLNAAFTPATYTAWWRDALHSID